MNCQDIARFLDDREVDDMLAMEQSDVQAHLATCRDCARDWQLHAKLSTARIPAVPVELTALYSSPKPGISDAIEWWRRRWVATAAFVAVAAVAATLVLQMNSSRTPVAVLAKSPQADPGAAEPAVPQLRSEVFSLPKGLGPQDESREVEEWMRRVIDWLAVRDDPDALMTAAMLLSAPRPDARRIHSLFQRATALAPDSARINATAMLLCQALRPCDAAPYEQVLRQLAPDNALGWIGDAQRASKAGDQEALRKALAAMARTRTFDLYWNPGIVAMVSRISAALVAPPDISGGSSPRFIHEVAVGPLAAMAIPAFGPITDFCKSATDEGALLECRKIGAAMRAGDTVIVNLIGLAVSGSGLRNDSAEARSLEQQKRQIRWINSQGGLTADDPRFPALVAEHPREIDTLRAFLEERGIPTEPPADWKR